ncbi:hypothetical protein GCM10010240_56980 [Streptomyces griseoviridis]|jgi:hypothetical protein|nr:hypothetical protein GCM10010240_56980 [Streptomyces griseoviridis]
MSADILTPEAGTTVDRDAARRDDRQPAPGRAAREPGPGPGESGIAPCLGRLTTVPGEGGGGRVRHPGRDRPVPCPRKLRARVPTVLTPFRGSGRDYAAGPDGRARNNPSCTTDTSNRPSAS